MIGSSLIIFAFSILAGFIGSLLGLGGGIIIIPALTLLLNVPIHEAIGASIVSVIATSSGAAIAYVRDKITNIRIGMFLETATTLGAITGAFIAGLIEPKVLYIVFAVLMIYSAGAMFHKRHSELPMDVVEHPVATRLKLSSAYYDKALDETVAYKVTGVYPGYAVMYGAGVISGLLGIGSGVFKVLGMDVFMKLPMKVSTATSNFMIGVTAAASAGVYFSRGDINPLVAGPVALGVLLGAQAGTKAMERLNNKTLRLIFIPILLYVALQMLWKGWWM
ncbi:sulfite exporter TauE/SafE family protein [Acididesulfobacillus acetoxydans]|uniref:sulfite exporter TauE/SafE family protein n=1 Tax=Acididesulfobacillus acetoxydans TaxID=1561005 RepID=UPI001F0E89D0|nr:sulfite exporter TauE/SafE family protein [Acididesulfobacillus acetoxydans]